MRGVLVCCLLSILLPGGWGNPIDIVLQKRAGTPLQNLRLYADSTFSQPTRDRLLAGQLVEVLSESEIEHEDDAQKQTFKWYRIRSLSGQEGWVFGDGLAVSTPTIHLSPALRDFQHQQLDFGSGFERAIIWSAGVLGLDLFHAYSLLIPLYSESYLVLTNVQGRSVPIYYGGEGTQGKSELRRVEFQELTGDSAPELVLLQDYYPLNATQAQRQIELYSFQAGSVRKIFEERLSLPSTDDHPCPYKYVELDKGSIRVEYIEALPCSAYHLPLATGASQNDRPCLEYVTSTYSWDRQQKRYRILYEESRAAPQVRTTQAGVVLQAAPTATSERLRALSPNETVDVIRERVTFTPSRRGTLRASYLYVRLADGKYGYLPTPYTRFVGTAHAEQLDRYFRREEQPTLSEEWLYYGIRGLRRDSSVYNR